MTHSIKLAPNLSLPAEAVTQTFALLARRGAGKTHTASVLAEEMLAAGFPIVWIDPIGVAWGLRSKFSILILGGEHGDLPLESTAGKVVAEFAVAKRVPIILDVSAFGENEMRRFVGDFAQRFYHVNREPVHVFIDEADEFAPQSPMGEQAKCLGAVQNLTRRGRARGIGVTLVTQRSAVLSKSVLTQTEVLIAMQTTGPQDLKAIQDWIKYHGTQEECDTIIRSLPGMQQGEGWVYSPGWLKILQRVKFRPRHSFDSSRTPKPGEVRSQPKSLAEVDLAGLTKEMQSTIEKAKADDPKLLRKRIADLETQFYKSAKGVQGKAEATDSKAIDRAVQSALSDYSRQAAERDKGWQRAVKDLERVVGDFRIRLAKIGQLCQVNGELKIEIPSAASNRPVRLDRSSAPSPNRGREIPRPPSQPAKSPESKYRSPADAEGISLPKGEAAVLSALIQFPAGLRREQLTVLTGYKRSSRDAYIQRLREKGLVDDHRTLVVVNDAGRAALPDAEPLPTGHALQEYWLSRLPEGERAILQQLIDAYPEPVDRDELSEATGYKRSSRDAYLQRLRAKELVGGDWKGAVSASKELF